MGVKHDSLYHTWQMLTFISVQVHIIILLIAKQEGYSENLKNKKVVQKFLLTFYLYIK